MSGTNEAIQSEDQIPELVEKAIQLAVASAIAEGRSVLVTQDETLYEVFPDGTTNELKRLAPMTRIAPGQTRRLPE
jgi:hypothetical protein